MVKSRTPKPVNAVLLTLLLASVGLGAAQDYEWRDVVQTVEIASDGSVLVDDTRTLWTDDDFGEAFICVPHERDQSITILPGSGALGPGPEATAFTQSCAGGTELVVRNERRVSERRVRFVYRLEGTVDVYRDVVQWYWHILESEHPTVFGYQLTVTAPGPMPEPYDAYVHRFGNPEEPTISLSEDRSTLRVAFDRVPGNDAVEIRYLMDPALFTPKSDEDGYEELLIDESKVAGVEQRLLARRSPWWSALPLSLIGLLGVGAFRQFNRVGREPHVESMKYPFEPPTDLPPAAVSTIVDQGFNSSKMGAAFHATIMDLVRRGYGEFVEHGRKFDIRLFPDRPRDELLPFEADVLSYLHKAAGSSGDLLTFTELKRYSQSHASSFMSRWGKKVRDWLLVERGGELTTEESRRQAKRWAGWFVLAAAVCGVFVLMTDGSASAMMIIGAAVLVLLAIVAGVTLPSWRPEIAQEVAGWQGFKRTLTDYTRMKDAPLDFYGLWDVYYCYAAAMGVADKYLKTLERAAPLAGVDESMMVRNAAWMGLSGSNSGLSSFSGLSSSITSLSSALNSASASASSGGSSSGGGGGGGGGGSSGGR